MVKHPVAPAGNKSLSDFRRLATLNMITYLPTYLPIYLPAPAEILLSAADFPQNRLGASLMAH